jgi:restriction system protein
MGLITLAARLPWWGALLVALLMYLLVTQILPLALPGAMAQAFVPVLRMLGYMLAGVFVVGAVLGLAIRLKQNLIHDNQRSLRQVQELSWRDFEHLMAEAFRREGFVSSTTDPGADGGVDLVLSKDGERWLVQCKQWRTQRVGVKPVRELAGVVAAVGAAGGIFVCSGDYTAEARSFAQRAGMRLIDGATLSEMMRLESGTPSSARADGCPRCGSQLVRRVARRGFRRGQSFFGCASFPKCRYTTEG